MNPTLQRHCAKHIYIVPHGLRELMSDISREVIRAQPEDMYTFIADYLDAMMITRENARVAIRLVDEITEIAETIVELLTRTGLTREVVDEIVRIIQRYFREYLERKRMLEHPEVYGEGYDEVEEFTRKILGEINVDYDKLVEVTIIIQQAFRRFRERREREQAALFGMIDWRIAAASTIRLYRRTGVTSYEANRAATLIKAAYKGYYTRRIMKRLLASALDDQTTIETTIETDTLPEPYAIRSSSTLDKQASLQTEAIFVAGEQSEPSETQLSDAEEQILIELKTETPVLPEGVELGVEETVPQPALPEQPLEGGGIVEAGGVELAPEDAEEKPVEEAGDAAAVEVVTPAEGGEEVVKDEQPPVAAPEGEPPAAAPEEAPPAAAPEEQPPAAAPEDTAAPEAEVQEAATDEEVAKKA